MIDQKVLEEAIIKNISYKFCNRGGVRNPLRIGFGVDDNYARCMGVAITSICENNRGEDIEFYVVTDGIEEENLKKISVVAALYSIDIHIFWVDSSVFLRLPTQEHFPIAMYYRLVLPLILKRGKVLYLDADVFCLSRIDELIKFDFCGSVIAAVRDFPVVAAKREKALNLKEHTYFNSGVLFIDVEEWNKKNTAVSIINILLEKGKKLQYPDQDALNILFQDRVFYLDGMYNRINVTGESDAKDLLKKTKLIHFTAHPKPWNIVWKYSGHPLLKNIFSSYEEKSPWKGMTLELPRNYKHQKWYAQGLRKDGKYREAVHWYIQYLKTKYTN